MKNFRDYLKESEEAAENPVTGDVFAVNIREECLVESVVLEHAEDGVVIAADDRMLEIFESYGITLEDVCMECGMNEGDCGCVHEEYADETPTADPGEYGEEGDMAKNELATIIRAARRLTGMLDNDDDMPEWTQKKITKAADYVDTAADYISSQKERGIMEQPEDSNPVARAVLHRIMMQHPGVLATHGPERVMAAVDELADRVNIGPDDEIGSSDVSGWTRDVIRMLAELPDEPMNVGDALDESGVAEGYSLKKTSVIKYMEPGDPDEWTQDVNIKDTDYEIINNKTGQVVGTASWTTNDFFGPGALKITMNNGATRWLDIWASEKGNPQSAFNRFVKDPKTSKRYKEQGVAEGSLEEVSQQTLQSYRKKASAQKRAADDVVSGDADDETWKKNVNLSAKRRKGIDSANKRLDVAEGSSELTDLWQAGKEAAYLGKPMSACPYQMFSKEWEAWQQGWQDQKRSQNWDDSVYEQGVAEGEINDTWMNDRHREFYKKNPHFKRNDRERVEVGRGTQLATRVKPAVKPAQVQKKPATRFGMEEAEYQGRDVELNKPKRGGPKKFYVYVKNPKTGNVKKVTFGDPNMKIKKSNPDRRKSFRARHNCDNPGPKTGARYWSCRAW